MSVTLPECPPSANMHVWMVATLYGASGYAPDEFTIVPVYSLSEWYIACVYEGNTVTVLLPIRVLDGLLNGMAHDYFRHVMSRIVTLKDGDVDDPARYTITGVMAQYSSINACLRHISAIKARFEGMH